MTKLSQLDARTAKRPEILEAIERDGAAILTDAFSRAQIEQTLAALDPFIAGTRPIDDDFVGRQTTRTGGLVARAKHARQAGMHPVVPDAPRADLGRLPQDLPLH